MISYETQILITTYILQAPWQKNCFSTPSVSDLFVMKAVTVWHAILTTVF